MLKITVVVDDKWMFVKLVCSEKWFLNPKRRSNPQAFRWLVKPLSKVWSQGRWSDLWATYAVTRNGITPPHTCKKIMYDIQVDHSKDYHIVPTPKPAECRINPLITTWVSVTQLSVSHRTSDGCRFDLRLVFFWINEFDLRLLIIFSDTERPHA